MPQLLLEPILGLFVILAIGSWLGQISVKGISLGSAAVFFVALVFGHFGFKSPPAVTELGLLLFVYAVGLQAGPLFCTFRREAGSLVLTGLAAVGAGAVATVVMAKTFGFPDALAAGWFTGAVRRTRPPWPQRSMPWIVSSRCRRSPSLWAMASPIRSP